MRLCLGLIATGLLSSQLALAEPCVRPADLAAFDVASLKSQLMVTALTCDAHEKYNAFVLRFRTDLMTQERALHAWFVRGYGGRGQQHHDDYITLLANTQSQAGLRDGTLYCERNASLLDEVLSLPNGASLADYAATKGLEHAADLATCAVPQAGPQVAQEKPR